MGAGWGGPSQSPTMWILGPGSTHEGALTPAWQLPEALPVPGHYCFSAPMGAEGHGRQHQDAVHRCSPKAASTQGSSPQAICTAAWPRTRAGPTVTPAGFPPPHGRGLGTEVGPEAGAAGTNR